MAEQLVLPKMNEYQPLTDEQLMDRAVLATQMRTEIASNMAHHEGSLRDELNGEHAIAFRRETRLLRTLARRGLLGDFLEADWQNRGPKTNVSEEEMVWQAS